MCVQSTRHSEKKKTGRWEVVSNFGNGTSCSQKAAQEGASWTRACKSESPL